MRWSEIIGGYKTMISNEEKNFVDKIAKNGILYRENVNEREAELAKRLVTKGVIIRSMKNNKKFYKVASLEEQL